MRWSASENFILRGRAQLTAAHPLAGDFMEFRGERPKRSPLWTDHLQINHLQIDHLLDHLDASLSLRYIYLVLGIRAGPSVRMAEGPYFWN